MKKIIACLVVLFSIFTISLLNVKASLFIDEIHNYEITVNPNSDGTLDMEVYIRWEVINDKIDGPLTWIKVGIPNKFVSNIKSLTSNIDDIYYYSDGGSYIRLDLDREYYAGEIIDLKYSYTQARMYFLQDDECYYDYNPGWFDDIYVETAIVRWNAEGVIDANCSNIVDGYYIYQSSLHKGQTITVDMKYKQDYFRVLNPNLQFSNEYMTFIDYFAIIIVILIIVIAITAVIIILIKEQDPYMNERGFVGRGYFYHRHYYGRGGYYSSGKRISTPSSVNSGGFRGGGGSFSCACACACAGGGRAGCSMKDFYKNPKLEQIKKALD